MRTILLTHLRIAGLIGALGLLLAVPGRAQALPLLSLTPAAQSISLGQTTTVDLTITGLGSLQLGGWSADILYSSGILSFDAASTVFGSELSPSIQFVEDGPGSLWFHADETADVGTDVSNQPATFTLATFSFTGAGFGTSNLTFDFPDFVSLSDETGASLSFQVANASITVVGGSNVPESGAALPLLAFSFVLTILARRFHRNTI